MFRNSTATYAKPTRHLSRAQTQARSDAKLMAGFLVLAVVMLPLSVAALVALYPVSEGLTRATPAMIADATTICAAMAALAVISFIGVLASAIGLCFAVSRF